MMDAKVLILVSLLAYVSGLNARGNVDADSCAVLAQTEAGWVCGTKRLAVNGAPYASFRGVPYAQQPLGELRFQELQPVEPWDGVRNATIEGPVCPYHDIYYGPLVNRNGVSEACIFANVHVPAKALPRPGARASTRTLPILVFIHGGGWVCGSGDADFHGPEYLVGQDIIVVTFNYRLDMFGFLSLNTTKVPGNNGLRDAVTLLNWVQRNAQFFGGNPDEVTLAGHSAGSSNAHLLSLSPVTKGLFKRLWLMSGTAIPSYYSTSPAFTKLVTTTYLTILGLNGTDLDTVHDQLVQMPLEVLNNASGTLLAQLGVTSFVPVVESPLPNVTAILTEDPEKLIADGVGNEIPIIVGFTSDECEANRPRLREINAVELYKEDPTNAVPPHWIFTLPSNATAVMAEKIGERYFGDDPTMDDFVNVCTDSFFTYPAIKLAQLRAESGGAPIYLYKFSYEAKYSLFKAAFNLTYSGAAHGEDLNRVLKFNTFPVPAFREDLKMSSWISNIVAHFVRTGVPLPRHKTLWPPQSSLPLRYQEFAVPGKYNYRNLTSEEQDMVEFFDGLRDV